MKFPLVLPVIQDISIALTLGTSLALDVVSLSVDWLLSSMLGGIMGSYRCSVMSGRSRGGVRLVLFDPGTSSANPISRVLPGTTGHGFGGASGTISRARRPTFHKYHCAWVCDWLCMVLYCAANFKQ